MIKDDTYFIASARCYLMKSADGTVHRNEGDVVWLGESNHYPSCASHKNEAKHFRSAEEIRKGWIEWDGMPWWNRLKPDSLRIYKVHRREVVEVTEEEVLS